MSNRELENDPNGPLVFSRVDRVYRRVADHLRVLTLRDGMGREQVLKTTDDHPFFVIGQGQTSAGDLHVGELLYTPNELASQVVKTVREEHPDGIPVYNFRVEGTHTYFVRAQGSDATPVWVHNANYDNAAKLAGAVHGNSALSSKTTILYRLEDSARNLLKWGITANPNTRYSAKFMEGKKLVEITRGARSLMMTAERWLIQSERGPLNLERIKSIL